MNNHISQNNIAGLIEYRGEIMAAHIPVPLLIMDAAAYALTRVEHNRAESLDSDYTVEERAEHRRRADAIEAWIDSGFVGTVPFRDDVTLYTRSVFSPVVVTRQNLDSYINAILAASTVVPVESLEAPQFLIDSNAAVAELSLTTHRACRVPRLYCGTEITVMEISVDSLKAIIANQKRQVVLAATTNVA